MNFFAHQAEARRKTSILIVYFAMAVIAIALALNALAFWIYAIKIAPEPPLPLDWAWFDVVRLPFVPIVTGCTLLLIFVGSAFKVMQLRTDGPEGTAASLGGRWLQESREPNERRLLNVVEEMAIASGIPIPKVYVFDRESGINAFAAGFEPSQAVIGVTRGTLEALNRDELQGVIAHEFSHIFNGDMRMNLYLLGVLNGILLISISGRIMLEGLTHSRSTRGKDGVGIALVFFAFGLLAVGSIGVFFGRWIKSAISRQREFLADASAVQFTRNPSGIGGALKKIMSVQEGSRVTNSRSEELSHFFFANAVGSFFNLFATHPPLEERIRRIDKSILEPPTGLERRAPAKGLGINTDKVLNSVGELDHQHLALAAQIVAEAPRGLRASESAAAEAEAVVFSLFYEPKSDDEFWQIMRGYRAGGLADLTAGALVEVAKHSPDRRLAILDLALSRIKSLNLHERRNFLSHLEQLAMLGDLHVFEVCLLAVAQMQLLPLPPHLQTKGSLQSLKAPLTTMLAALVHCGSENSPEQRAAAFATGTLLLWNQNLVLPSRDELNGEVFYSALKELRKVTTPQLRQEVISAFVAVALKDRDVCHEEFEILRAIGELCESPLPPQISNAQS